ncbi:hypothetical protein [Iningainema tapete]|uniref:Uncharacterized protein n=1 Tax=Iningainema tapete BLCC-T55 TaxID=2748662 RepID=A0A8J6XBQ4_9CYAN|nr:hypothetical protein [Iningainema tapete]MBD2772355.1 hypothetical protein [Iningainema tapete BLCC-T55]
MTVTNILEASAIAKEKRPICFPWCQHLLLLPPLIVSWRNFVELLINCHCWGQHSVALDLELLA